MLHTREELHHYLETERAIYLKGEKWGLLMQLATKDPKLAIYRFQTILRKEAYYHSQSGMLHKLCYLHYQRKRNTLGRRLGLEIWPESFDEGLRIEHAGNIVVNGHARIGRNCILHGSNCIGNNGLSSQCPVLGDNIRLGVGSKIIGDVTLADGIIVAAGAVVVHSFDEPGITIAGVPARKVK